MKVVEDFDVIAIETIQPVQSGNPYTRFLILANIAHRYFATIHLPHPMF